MRRNPQEFTRSQRSLFVPWRPGATKENIPGDTFYSRMLIEDTEAGVAAIGRPLRAAIEPPALDAERLIARALTRKEHRDLNEAVRDFLIESTRTLLAFNHAAYEIVYSLNSFGKPVSFDLQYIPTWTLKRSRGGWLQSIPPAFVDQADPPRKIYLPAESVFNLRPPEPIRKFLRLALAQATRKSGWSARDLLRNEMTDVYLAQRILRFEAFKIEIRDSVVAQLNEIFTRVGIRLGFSGAISISGVPTRAQAEEAMQALQVGSASIANIIKPFLT